MASPTIFTDGFDVYGPPGVTPALNTQWTNVSGSSAVVAGLSSPGYALRLNSNSSCTKTMSAGYTRITGSVRFKSDLGTNNNQLLFQNGATAVCCFTIETNGVINFRTGGAAGAIVAAGAAVATGSTHVLTFDIIMGASAAYTVYLDGVLYMSGSGNTANSQSSYNTIVAFQTTSGTALLTIDDLILIDPTQPNYNSTLLTSNPVIETQFVSGDTQTQFANDGNVIPVAGVAAYGIYKAVTNMSVAIGLWLLKITPLVNCTLNSVSAIPSASSGAAKYKGVVYADSAGAPGALLSSGNEVIGATAAATLTLPLVTPQAFIAGTSYWIGLICDTTVNFQQYDNATNLGRFKANTYASGAPNPAGATTGGQGTLQIWGNCTGAAVSWPSLSLNPPLGTAQAQTHSSTVGQEDLFGFPPLVTNPTTIFGMAVKGFVSKSDAGARTASFNAKSGAADTTGSAPSQGLATTPQWQGSYFDVDPATGLPWTTAGANAAKAGVSVAS